MVRSANVSTETAGDGFPTPPPLEKATRESHIGFDDDTSGEKGKIKAVRTRGGSGQQRKTGKWLLKPSREQLKRLLKDIYGKSTSSLEVMLEDGRRFFWKGASKNGDATAQWETPTNLLVLYDDVEHNWLKYVMTGGLTIYFNKESGVAQSVLPDDLKDEEITAAHEALIRQRREKKHEASRRKRAREKESTTTGGAAEPQHRVLPGEDDEAQDRVKRMRQASPQHDIKAEAQSLNPTRRAIFYGNVTLEAVTQARKAAGHIIPDNSTDDSIAEHFPAMKAAGFTCEPALAFDVNRHLAWLGLDRVVSLHHSSPHNSYRLAEVWLHLQDQGVTTSMEDAYLAAMSERYHGGAFKMQDEYFAKLFSADCRREDWPASPNIKQLKTYNKLARAVIQALPSRQGTPEDGGEEAVDTVVFMLFASSLPTHERADDPERHGWEPPLITHSGVQISTFTPPQVATIHLRIVLRHFLTDETAVDLCERMAEDLAAGPSILETVSQPHNHHDDSALVGSGASASEGHIGPALKDDQGDYGRSDMKTKGAKEGVKQEVRSGGLQPLEVDVNRDGYDGDEEGTIPQDDSPEQLRSDFFDQMTDMTTFLERFHKLRLEE